MLWGRPFLILGAGVGEGADPSGDDIEPGFMCEMSSTRGQGGRKVGGEEGVFRPSKRVFKA